MMSARTQRRGRLGTATSVLSMTLVLVSLDLDHVVAWGRWYPAMVAAFLAGAVGSAIAYRFGRQPLLNLPTWLRRLVTAGALAAFLAPVLLLEPTGLAIVAVLVIGFASTAAVFWPEVWSGGRAPRGT